MEKRVKAHKRRCSAKRDASAVDAGKYVGAGAPRQTSGRRQIHFSLKASNLMFMPLGFRVPSLNMMECSSRRLSCLPWTLLTAVTVMSFRVCPDAQKCSPTGLDVS